MSGEETRLPEDDNFIAVLLEDVCELITDGTHHSPVNGPSGDFRYVTAKNIKKHGLDLSDTSYVTKEVHEEIFTRCPARFGDVLYIKDGATTGIAAINTIREPISLLSSVALIRPKSDALDARYLRYWLNSPDTFKRLTGAMTGTAIRRIVLRDLRSATFSLAPLAVQKVIADTLDALLAQVDTLKGRLDAIPAILKRFRQSVLSAAVTGKLTEEWRGGEEFSWKASTVGDVAEVKGGKRLPQGESVTAEKTDYPYIRVTDFGDFSVDYVNVKYVSDAAWKQISRYTISVDDVYISIAGTIGVVGMIPSRLDGANLTENAAKIVIDPSRVCAKFMMYQLASPIVQDEIRSAVVSNTQPKLALFRIQALPFSIPPLSEQTEIVKRVEALLGFADQIEARVQEAQTRVKNLTQSILAKAFRGELTAAWRAAHPELVTGENSAAALLERIRASRAQNAAEGSGKGKRGRKTATAPDHVPQATVPSGSSTDGTAEPRRRGRPRKS